MCREKVDNNTDNKETLRVIYETNYSQLNKMLDSITDMDHKLTIVISIDSIALPLIIGNTPATRIFQILLCISLIFVSIGFFLAVNGLMVKAYSDSPDPKTLFEAYHNKSVNELYSDAAQDFAEKYHKVKEDSNLKKIRVNESFLFSAIGLVSAILIIFVSKVI